MTLSFSGGVGGVSGDLGPFDSIAERVLLNYTGFGSRGARAQADTGHCHLCRSLSECENWDVDYLMVVDEDLFETVGGETLMPAFVGSLASHRAAYNGYNVAIVSDVTVATHYGAPAISDDAVWQFIHDLYDEGEAEHMADGHLGYALLVGDAQENVEDELIPAHELALCDTCSSTTTDHWYACVDGADAYPDVMIGRLCVRDTTELRREVQRFLRYERDALSSQAWRDNVLLSCGFAWVGCDTSDLDFISSVDATFDTIGAMPQVGLRYTVHEIHAHEEEGEHCDPQNCRSQ